MVVESLLICTSKSWFMLSAVFADVSMKNIPFFSAYSRASCGTGKNKMTMFMKISLLYHIIDRKENMQPSQRKRPSYLSRYTSIFMKISLVTDQSHDDVGTAMLLKFLQGAKHNKFIHKACQFNKHVGPYASKMSEQCCNLIVERRERKWRIHGNRQEERGRT